VGSDGTVSVTLPPDERQQVGVIQLASFSNPAASTRSATTSICRPRLQAIHHRRAGGPDAWAPFSRHAGAGQRKHRGRIREHDSGAASYESNSRVVKAADEMLQGLNQLAQ